LDTIQFFNKDSLKLIPSQNSDQFSNSALSMFFFLFILILIIVLLAFLYKKYVLKQVNFKRFSRNTIYQVLEYQVIGPKEKILVIKILTDIQIILLNEQSIQILKEIPYESYQDTTRKEDIVENRFLSSLKEAMSYVKK
jgi:flagellar biogenesis protein FliO